jgi:transcriptional regulator with XRE-family HTH domain
MPAPSEFIDRFRWNLRRLRRHAGLSQEQLASRASLHRTEVGFLEQGHRVPRIDTLVKLAAALEVTPNDLLEGVDWMPPRGDAEGTFWTLDPLGNRLKGVGDA